MASPWNALEELTGLEGAKKAVRRLATDQSGVHAALFYGQPGSGTTSCALALAQAWLCPNRTEEGPCGECGVCKSHEAGRAVDFQRVDPWGASSLIKLSAVREAKPGDSDPFSGVPIQSFFRTRPLMARNKVVLFEHAERMNPDAANALLKILEEPPGPARILFTTSEVGRVLPTIRSRCLCVACEVASWTPSHSFADGPGAEEKMRESESAYQDLEALLGSYRFRLEDAMGLSKDVRAWAESLAKKTDLTTRQAHAESVRCLALWIRRQEREGKAGPQPQAIQAADAAYRALLQNGSASLVLDGLFSKICSIWEQRGGAAA